NTTDVVATIGRVLHMGALSKYDHFGRPLSGVFSATADTSAYVALVPGVSRHETNPDSTAAARLSRGRRRTRDDLAHLPLFTRMLWQAIKGPARPCPQRSPQPHS